MQNEFGASHIIEMMEFSQDKEVQANCAKIIRLCLRDDMVSFLHDLDFAVQYYEQMTMVFSELGNLLLKNCASFIFEQSALSELLGCFRNFTRQAPKLTFINRQFIGVLIKLAKMPPSDKIQK